MKPWILLFTGLAGGGAVAGTTMLATTSGANSGVPDSNTSAEIATLRNELDALRKDHAELLNFANSLKAAQPQAEARQAVVVSSPTKVAGTESAVSVSAVNVSAVDRDVVFALIKEERDLRERERQEKQRQQMREGMDKRMTQAAERVGLDANTTRSVVKLYLDNLDREAEIRKAYSGSGRDDPNSEKRKLELEAARKELDASVSGMIPADKKESWDRSTRFIKRGADFAAMAEGVAGDGTMLRGLLNAGGGGGRRNDRPGGNNNGEPKAPKPPKSEKTQEKTQN